MTTPMCKCLCISGREHCMTADQSPFRTSAAALYCLLVFRFGFGPIGVYRSDEYGLRISREMTLTYICIDITLEGCSYWNAIYPKGLKITNFFDWIIRKHLVGNSKWHVFLKKNTLRHGRRVMQSFNGVFAVGLSKLLHNYSNCRWFEMSKR